MSSDSARQARTVPAGGARARQRRDRARAERGPGTAARVRWDRLGGLALLLVGAALMYLYLSAGIRMLSTWRQAHYDSATVASLQREHGQLERRHETLRARSTVEEAARQLGMIKQGEQSYVVSGLPNN